jgi:YVTN family beta-propeller protein
MGNQRGSLGSGLLRVFWTFRKARNLAVFALAPIITLVTSQVAFAIAVLPGPSHSTNIALTYDNTRVVVANRAVNTISVIQVRNSKGQDSFVKLAEIPVGIEPECVAITPDNARVFVTNGVDGTVSAVSLVTFRTLATIRVGTEPRGCALTPSGGSLFVANFNSANVSEINTTTYQVTNTIPLSGHPYAVAISDNGNGNDNAETIWITDFFARLIPEGPGEGFDTGKFGLVWAIPFVLPSALVISTLSPLTNVGFTADRTDFCPQSAPNPSLLHSTIFCPSLTAPKGSSIITKNPQGCFPNQLYSGVIRGVSPQGQLRLSTICAEPEPPVSFNTNIQAVVKAINTNTLAQITSEDTNINAQINEEPKPTNPAGSLQHLFLGDFVAIDATLDGSLYLLVSRNNDYVIEATVNAAGQLDVHAPNNVVRFITGHIPTGVVISTDGTRAYTNNEVSTSVSVLNLSSGTTLAEVPASEPPAPGTEEAIVRVGKLVFFTGLGVPLDDSIFSTPVQNIPTLANRDEASKDGWSSCASCHPDGLSDHVTWIFAAGPRRSIPLDGTIDKDNPLNSRVLLWSATRDSNTDFNQNSIGVQNGTGFAAASFKPFIYDHGITEGVPAWDALTTWVQVGARPLLQPQPPASQAAALAAGQAVFQANCAFCHGGPKWTKSEIFYIDDPSFTSNPNVVAPALPGIPIDPGIKNAGAQIVSLTRPDNTFEKTFDYLVNVGTFNKNSPLEIRGQTVGAAIAGQEAAGGLGFNVPSLLSVADNAPYLHNGQAQTLQGQSGVFGLHQLPGGKSIFDTLNATEQADLLLFLNSIDGRTALFQSEAELFKEGE